MNPLVLNLHVELAFIGGRPVVRTFFTLFLWRALCMSDD